MDENEIYEAFGLTPPEPEEPQGTEAPQDVLQDSRQQEAQETPEDRTEPVREAVVPSEDAIRAAVDAALAKQAEANQRQIADIFARVGLQDPGTGKTITTLEEFDAYQRGEEARRLSRNLQEGKLLPEDLQALIGRAVAASIGPAASGGTPAGAGLRPGPSEGQKEAPEGGVTKEQIDRELAAIHQMDARVNSLEDILKLETGPAFETAVRRGNSFLDAFRLANFEAITRARQEEAAAKAAQAAVNTARSKDHLLPSEARGTGAAAVPGDVMALYRQLLPGKSEADITKHYNRFLAEAGKEI